MKLEPGALVWPSKVIKALEALSKGPAHSRVDSGEVLSIAISDLGLLSLPYPSLLPSVDYGYTLFNETDAPNFLIDGHYPVRELWDRATNCWDRILAHDSKSVLVVAHNAMNQALFASALGLGTDYFRRLLQSNCGVSVLDFTPSPDGGSPHICLNRLD